jgi:hypothetical protein
MNDNIEIINEERRIHFRSWILVFKCKMVIKIKLRKWGPDTHKRQARQIKDCFTL